jgi:hypothetical protein
MKKTIVLVTVLLASVLLTKNSFAQSQELVRVFSWYDPEDRNYVTVAENEYQEGQMLNWKWKDKTLLFIAYRNPGPDRVAVYSWYNPVTKDYISLSEEEFTDDALIKSGYTQKHLQFYALARKGTNIQGMGGTTNTIPVYRWNIEKTQDWITVPEEGNTDVLIKKGYTRKTFQYYGIKRASDVKIYDQL